MNVMISALENETSRYMTDREKIELKESYSEVAKVLGMAQKMNPDLAEVTLSTSSMVLEYHLPKASAWCDLVLLGKGENHPEVMIIELKNYRKASETKPGCYEGLIWHNGEVRLHPAAQVRQYTKYCQYFHSTVVEESAQCSGLVFFTQDIDLSPYSEGPNSTLCTEYPLFNSTDSSVSSLAGHIANIIKTPDDAFAQKFILGDYKQNRNILKQVAESLQNLKDSDIRNPFVLLDGQDLGFSKVLSTIESLKESDKEVVIVSGPPGSGKSAVAANLWVECAKKYRDRGNVLFVATSSSQFDPWAKTFSDNAGIVAKGMVIKANAFNPGINGSIVKDKIAPYFATKDKAKYFHGNVLRYDLYEDYLEYAAEKKIIKPDARLKNTQYISIVDEAHALIDPSAPHFSTNKSGGWCYQVGPQAYHIINQTRVSIFLMDDRQSFRDNETTSIESIRRYAEKLGAHVTEVSLEGMQFRCAGSKEYVDWVEGLFSPEPLLNHKIWEDRFEFKLAESPDEVDRYLKGKNTSSVRILSTYTREWTSRNTLKADHTGCKDWDFILKNSDGTEYKKFWNNPNAYDIFVNATEGSTMHEDPLSEVGCPYCVRGYDFDYVGILSLNDIIWRDGWYIDMNNCLETATASKRKLARDEASKISGRGRKSSLIPLDEKHPQAVEYATTIIQSYRILLTRGIKGVCMYIEDAQTREHIKSLLNE